MYLNWQGILYLYGYPNIDYSTVDFIFFFKSQLCDMRSKVKHFHEVFVNLLLWEYVCTRILLDSRCVESKLECAKDGSLYQGVTQFDKLVDGKIYIDDRLVFSPMLKTSFIEKPILIWRNCEEKPFWIFSNSFQIVLGMFSAILQSHEAPMPQKS